MLEKLGASDKYDDDTFEAAFTNLDKNESGHIERSEMASFI